MQSKTLNRILTGLRTTHKNAFISARRWLNTYVVTMSTREGDVVAVMEFKDHQYLYGDSPLGMLSDTICSLPSQQQLPLICLLGDVVAREQQTTATILKITDAVQDLKLENLALKHDAESSKRERDTLRLKYEGKK